MTTEELLFFCFIVIFFMAIWLVEVIVDRVLTVFLLRLRILRLWVIVIFLLLMLGFVLAPELTHEIMLMILKAGIIVMKMFVAAIQEGMSLTK